MQRHTELDELACGLRYLRGCRRVHHGTAVDTGEDAQDAALNSLAHGPPLPDADREPGQCAEYRGRDLPRGHDGPGHSGGTESLGELPPRLL